MRGWKSVMEKSQIEDNASFSDDPSQGLSSSISDNKTSIKTPRESEVSVISSERVQLVVQTSVISDLSSVAGKDGKDSNTVQAEASQEEPTKKAQSPHNQLKTLSSSSKESGHLAQLSSIDSVDLKPRQSSNENTVSECSHLSDGSLCVLREQDVSHDTCKKADIVVDHWKGGKNVCYFDLNEGTEPIIVVAKVGIPVGKPKKPLQFCGELGWRSSVTTSAFRPTFSSKTTSRETGACCDSSRQSLASQGIDLNIAPTMDSEAHEDYNCVDFGRFPLNLDLGSETGQKNCHRQGGSRFDFNNSWKNTSQIGENMTRNYITDSRRPSSYWVVPIQSDISFLPSTFYPPGVLPRLSTNNQHPMAAVIPHLSASVIGAYPGAIHVMDSPQVLYPAAYATPMRPSLGQNSGISLMENGNRNVEFFVPMRNGLPPLSTKRREPEGGWDYSQVNCRTMTSWK